MAASDCQRYLTLLIVAGTLSSCSLLEDPPGAPPPKIEKWRTAFDEGYKARRKKDWPAAQENYSKALQLAKAANTDDRNIAEILTEIGGVYAKQKQWLRSDETLSGAQAIYEKLWNPARGGVNNRDHAINLSKVLLSRATVQLNAGDGETAFKTIQKAYETAEAAPAPDHVKGEIMKLKSMILDKLGKAEEAVELREGATIFEATMDERTIAANKANWQQILDEADRAIGALNYDYAEKAYNKALEQLATRPDGMAKARALSGLATVYDARKNYERAEFYLTRSIKILEKGIDNPARKKLEIQDTHRLAKVQLHANKLAEAEKNIRHAIELEKKERDSDGFRRNERKLIDALIDILEAEKKYKDAEKILKEKLEFERQKYGDKSLKLSENYGKLGKLAALDGRIKEANQYYEKSIERFDSQTKWNPKEKIDVLAAYVKHLHDTGSNKKREAELTAKLESERAQIRKLFPF